MTSGYFSLVLHCHLPYVLSHGTWPHGSDWLYEAAAETYLPLLQVIDELVSDGVSPRLTVSLSPVLCEQLADRRFRDGFIIYLDNRIDAAERDQSEFLHLGRARMHANAADTERRHRRTRDHFESLLRNIPARFGRLAKAGHIELITCGATHGYYPLLSRDESLQAQTRMAVESHRHHFGIRPRGIWLPECAYRPAGEWTPPVAIRGKREPYVRTGVDQVLAGNSLEYFVVDSALLPGWEGTRPRASSADLHQSLAGRLARGMTVPAEIGHISPHELFQVKSGQEPQRPIAVFARDPQTGAMVWSGEHGYPGDSVYLEFHKKHYPGGHRYWAVTAREADLGAKKEYAAEAANQRAGEHAEHFVTRIREILSEAYQSSGTAGVLVAPYDAELFGHWWFEGPVFLKAALRILSGDQSVQLSTLSEHLDRTPKRQTVTISEGSWGLENTHMVWVTEKNEWTWYLVYEAESVITRWARFWRDHPDRQTDELTAILKQAARELMLLSASDWQFLIASDSAADYAENRVKEHYSDFKRLIQLAQVCLSEGGLLEGDRQFLHECERKDRLFSSIDLNWFAG